MYGIIHCCFEDLVLNVFGEETWKEILKRSGVKLSVASFLMHKVYDDEVTFKLIATTSEVVGTDIDSCLEAFGGHFLKYCQKNGYDKILRVLGIVGYKKLSRKNFSTELSEDIRILFNLLSFNLNDFLTNLDNFHYQLRSIFPEMRAPSFRVTHTPNGTMHLHYYSERKGLSAFVKGLVCSLSKEFFDTELVVNTVEDKGDGHVIMEVVPKNNDTEAGQTKPLSRNLKEHRLSSLQKYLMFSSATLCEAFPFHMIFRSDFQIIQIGNSLKRLSHSLWMTNKGPKFSDLFIISRPVIEFTFESILNNCNQVFVVKSTDQLIRTASTDCENSLAVNQSTERQCRSARLHPSDSDDTVPKLRLNGQMVPLPESDSILFLCSPRVNGLEDMKRLGLYMTDIPIHDRTRDLILMSHSRRGERELVEKLDEATNHIRILDTKLRDENKRTEEILHNIFPAKIANLLCANIKVKAESFEPVTCLFSDIVGFTAMCGHPRVEPMDVVRLLNKLYIQFDNLTNFYGVYKVETIGDAYIVIGGLPDPVEDHADRVVQMGLAMVKVTYSVLSPVEGHHIQMRIGIHSGSCMAGIVGLQMPRYCLFGNTVTLANKMESNSKPGHVHISEETKRHLIQDKYFFSDSPQTVLPFSTYFVTKIDDNYREESGLSVMIVSSGGHFKSPSPTHTPLGNSGVGAPVEATPLVTPYHSPKDSPHKSQSIYGLFDTKIQNSQKNLKTIQIQDVRINVASSDTSPTNESPIGVNNQSIKGGKNVTEKENSSLELKSNKRRKFLSFISDLSRGSDSTHYNKSKTKSNDNQNISELIIGEKLAKGLDRGLDSSNESIKKSEKPKKRKHRFLILFCFGQNRGQNTSINKIRDKSKRELSKQNIKSNKKCIKSNVNNGIEDDMIGRQYESSDCMAATTSQSTTAIVNYKEKRRKKHRFACFSCRTRGRNKRTASFSLCYCSVP